jgi:hypothetical protein
MVCQNGKATNGAQQERRRALVPVRHILPTSITDTSFAARFIASGGEYSAADRHSNFLLARLGSPLHAISTEFGGLHA